MSIILDALTRAERERRNADAAPDILAVTPEEPRSHNYRAVVVIAVVAVIGTLMWIYLNSDSDEESTNEQSPVHTQAERSAVESPRLQQQMPTPIAKARPVPTPETVPTIETKQPSSSDLVEARDGQDLSGPSPSVTALYAQSTPDEDAVAEEGSETLAYRSSAMDTGSEIDFQDRRETSSQGVLSAEDVDRASPALDAQEILDEVRAISASSDLAPHPVPLLTDLSKQFRDEVPTLIYLRHDFNSTGVSTVRINGEDLREGQRTRQVVIREILPDSVILTFRDTEFRLRALNSWVNL